MIPFSQLIKMESDQENITISLITVNDHCNDWKL